MCERSNLVYNTPALRDVIAQHYLSSLIPCCLGQPLNPGPALATNIQAAADIQTPTQSQQSGASASWPMLAAAGPAAPHSLALAQPAGADLAVLALAVRGLHQADAPGCRAEPGRQRARSLGLAQPGGEDLAVLALVVRGLHQADAPGCRAEPGRQRARSLGLAQPGGEDLVVLALVVAVLHQALVEALGQVLGLLAALLLLARLVRRLLPLLALLSGITCSMSTSEQRFTHPLTCKQLIQHELT